MILQAQTVSSIVLDQLNCAAGSGSVHSVFDRTVNILCGNVHPDAAWVSLHAPGVPMHPHAVLLGPGEDWRDWRDGEEWKDGEAGRAAKGLLGARVGERVDLAATEIVLGAGRVTVGLGGAAVWSPWLQPFGGASESPAGSRVDTIMRSMGRSEITSPFLRRAGFTGSVEEALTRKCLAIKKDLRRAWRLGDMESAARAMMSAVGLGSGLTPSGDDFLVGFLGAAHFFASGDDGRAEAARSLPVGRSMTTAPAFFMLKGALAGFLPDPLSCLLRALAREDERGVGRAVGRLTELGATSGQDMLAGVICYLEARESTGEDK